MPNLFNIDFLEFLQLLDKHDVDYLLVGGYAVILHGYGRSTGDMDLWINQTVENYNKLQLVYKDFGAPIFSIEDFESGVKKFLDSGQQVSKRSQKGADKRSVKR